MATIAFSPSVRKNTFVTLALGVTRGLIAKGDYTGGLIRKFNGVDLFVAAKSTFSFSTFLAQQKRAGFVCVLLLVLCFVVQVLSARDQHSRIKSEMNFFFDSLYFQRSDKSYK